MMRCLLATLLLAFSLSAADVRQQLMDADVAFERDTIARGLDGWMSWFAPDAILNAPGGPVKGKEALRAFYAKMFARAEFTIRWKPFHASVSKDGKLGYTLGTSLLTWKDADGKPQRHEGRYITVWRRQSDGTWKVETDLGG